MDNKTHTTRDDTVGLRARAISPGLIGKRVTKIGSRHSQTVSHRCVLKYVKYQKYISTVDYGTMPSS